MTILQTVEVPVRGMDCAHCVETVHNALIGLPGVQSADVLLSAEKAVIRLDPSKVDTAAIRTAVESVGYSVPNSDELPIATPTASGSQRSVVTTYAVVFAVAFLILVIGEGLGLFAQMDTLIPWPVGLAVIVLGGYPIFLNVIRATRRRQVISHTLMSLGVLAALLVGQWTTAAVVVFLMRMGDYTERFTTERSRTAVKDLIALAPQKARVERDHQELDVPIGEVQLGEIVIVRPSEQIPVDGEVVSGQATVNQATITGESMPVEAAVGRHVFAATFAESGSIRVRTVQLGADTTFGKIIKLVEEAESHRASVQRIADKFSAYYLPVVAGIALLTLLIRRDPLAMAAVMVVACSCSFAIATPIAILASIGAGAKRGVLVKGGKYLELLDKATVILVDKTGTLTVGRPRITDVISLNGWAERDLVRLAASAERYSEHPLAEALRQHAKNQDLPLFEPQHFTAAPGLGVAARVDGHNIRIGNNRFILNGTSLPQAATLQTQGKTLLFMSENETLIALFGASDTVRSEVPEALQAAREMGITQIELLTGDNEQVASALANELGIDYRANLLPEDKIAVVKSYQAQGKTVIMVGDGVNDAPALAQADVGIAMGAAGKSVAMEVAHVVLMREDWSLVPDVLSIAHRTMRIVKMNIAFTVVYNIVGLSLAALGILPPVLAAAAQSLPDLGILANSSRLLRYRPESGGTHDGSKLKRNYKATGLSSSPTAYSEGVGG